MQLNVLDDQAEAMKALDGKKIAVAMLCVTLMCAAGFEQHDSRQYLSGASNRPPGRHRIQNVEGPVLDPCAKQMYFKRGQKWTLLGSKRNCGG